MAKRHDKLYNMFIHVLRTRLDQKNIQINESSHRISIDRATKSVTINSQTQK